MIELNLPQFVFISLLFSAIGFWSGYMLGRHAPKKEGRSNG